jgi:serine/threonine-protein phosphatase PGAM5
MQLICCLALLLLVTAPSSAMADEAATPAARTLILVRHGQYLDDPAADPKLGPGMSPLGVAQARMAGARLAALPYDFDALYVSPLQRARDTAASIDEAIGSDAFRVLDDLSECTPATRRKDIMEHVAPGETAACKAQLDRLFAEHFKPASGAERHELLVCHGNVIRYLVMRALDVDSTAWLSMSVGHASLTTIRVEADGRIKVLGVGDTGHIPNNLATHASTDPSSRLVPRALPVRRGEAEAHPVR